MNARALKKRAFREGARTFLRVTGASEEVLRGLVFWHKGAWTDSEGKVRIYAKDWHARRFFSELRRVCKEFGIRVLKWKPETKAEAAYQEKQAEAKAALRDAEFADLESGEGEAEPCLA